MIIIDCEQNTPEWFDARRGKVSASRIGDILAKTAKGGISASRKNYRAELVAERLTGVTNEKTFSTPAMEWGKEQEDRARAMYEFVYEVELAKVGLVLHDRIADACASPDRLVGEDGLVEIKCPHTATHIDTLLGASIDGGYIKQMHWQMAVTGRQWCDFVSFDPRLPGEMQLHVERIERDPIVIAELERDVRAFLAEVEDTVNTLLEKFCVEKAA